MFYDEKLKRFRQVGETVYEDDQDVIPDGGAVSIRMTMMDSAQRAAKSGLTPDDLNAMHSAYWGK